MWVLIAFCCWTVISVLSGLAMGMVVNAADEREDDHAWRNWQREKAAMRRAVQGSRA